MTNVFYFQGKVFHPQNIKGAKNKIGPGTTRCVTVCNLLHNCMTKRLTHKLDSLTIRIGHRSHSNEPLENQNITITFKKILKRT